VADLKKAAAAEARFAKLQRFFFKIRKQRYAIYIRKLQNTEELGQNEQHSSQESIPQNDFFRYKLNNIFTPFAFAFDPK